MPLTEAASLAGMACAIPATADGGGHDETIPRTFLVLIDIATLALAFVTTGLVAPWVQWLLLPSGPLGLQLPASMSLPPAVGPDQFPPLRAMAWVLAVTCPLTVFFMELFGGYRQLVDQTRVRVFISSALSPLVALGVMALAFFALKDSNSSRVFIFTFGLVAISGLLTYRSMLRSYKRRRLAAGAYAKNVLLVGKSSAVRWMVDHFARNVPRNRYHLAGYMTVGFPDELSDLNLKSCGPVDNLGEFLIHNPVHEVIAVQSFGDSDWLRTVIESCDYFRVRLRIVTQALLAGSLRDLRLVFRSEPLGLPEVVLAPPHLETDALFLKRVIDIVVSAALLVLLTPLFILIAIAIKISTPGLSVFYPWRVIGLKGRPFTGYKFTTMVADAEKKRDELLSRNEMFGPVFKVKDDPRVTPLGRFLRKYSLNELPQLWSVLKGDMSLVGPRPAFRHELDRYELWHKRKLCVKPGITCLWQVRGRNAINSFDEWVRMDLEYIDHWSLTLDFTILARTVWAVVSGSGS
ncbi:MAG TPA: sugar transferase [Vicinamibacterales bacterium]|nr:sugar transferase [Vicinamibacterales bacterium]